MKKIVVTGGAGLVGQNLIIRLKGKGFHIVAIDKHSENIKILRDLNPDITIIEADLSVGGDWEKSLAEVDVIISNQAQISSLEQNDFETNNIIATERVLEAARINAVPYIVHISSSVVNSQAEDWYTDSKLRQEKLVSKSGIPFVILRPTLMFGWFDRKHLGWLSRFMKRSPLFPVPSTGKFLRQPLYVGDFCSIIQSCLVNRKEGSFNISGQELIHYIDIIRSIKRVIGVKTMLVRLPYTVFRLLLKTYSLFDRDPPFTVEQLEALVIPETFDIINWPGIFDVEATPFEQALRETFQNEQYSAVKLKF